MTLCGTVEAYVDGAWTDISDRVDVAEVPCESWHGRQTVLTDPDASTLTLRLRDNDRRFTPGVTTVYSDFDQGTPIRWTDVVSATTVWHFNGFVEAIVPQIVTDDATGEAQEQWALVGCVDLVTWLDRAPAFVSTLAAHIKAYAGSGTLEYFWPLTDTSAPFRPLVGAYPVLPSISRAAVRAAETLADFLPAGGEAVVGDDAAGVYLQVGVNGSSSSDSPRLSVGLSGVGGGIVPSSSLTNGTPTIVVWISPELPFDDTVTLLTWHVKWGVSSGVTCVLKRLPVSSGGVFELSYSGTLSGTLTTTMVVGTDRFHMIGAKVVPGNASTSITLWIDDQVYTGTGSGTGGLVTGLTCDYIIIGGSLQGTALYLQAYTGANSHAEFLEQRTVGLYGLYRQTVGDRIETVLGYAGLTSSQYDVDSSATQMQRADLAGLRPGGAVRAAAETDQGVWFGQPDGRATFQSRRLRYYDPGATPVQIDYEWLAQPMLARREQPINTATVGQSGGAVGYATDAASVAEIGERAFTASLQTACDADPHVLASFTVNQYATPKTRLQALVFEVDNLPEAAQLTLLSLGIGDRIQIVGAPSDWPTTMLHMSVEGRQMTASSQNTLTLTGSPVLGSAGGEGDTWFRLGTSALGGTHVLPF